MFSLHLSLPHEPVALRRQQPVLPGLGEVCIEVVSTGLCRSDLAIIDGRLRSQNGLSMANRIPGHEFSGRILHVGAAHTRFKQGQAVCVHPFIGCGHCQPCEQQHPEHCVHAQMLGLDRDGCFASFITVPERACFLPPNELALPTSARDWAILAYAEPVAAALGALDVLRRSGTDSRSKGAIVGQNRIALLTQQILIHYGFGVDILPLESLEHTTFRYDYLIESGLPVVDHPDLMRALLKCLKTGGQCILKSRHIEAVSVPVVELVRRDLRLQGAYYGDFAEAVALLPALNFEDLLGHFYDFEAYKTFLNPDPTEQRKPFLFAGAI